MRINQTKKENQERRTWNHAADSGSDDRQAHEIKMKKEQNSVHFLI